jgi:hypothetical protein
MYQRKNKFGITYFGPGRFMQAGLIFYEFSMVFSFSLALAPLGPGP